MKKTFITAYSIFVSIIFIFAVCIFGYNLFVEYSNGETRADSRFEQLSVSIKQVSIKKQVGSRDFYSQLEEIIGSYDDFAALQITYNNEIIFAYPGIGRLMYDAVLQEDINLVLANSMFISALVLVGMVISDILLAIVDPRIRYGNE